jgi:hypothetical protein
MRISAAGDAGFRPDHAAPGSGLIAPVISLLLQGTGIAGGDSRHGMTKSKTLFFAPAPKSDGIKQKRRFFCPPHPNRIQTFHANLNILILNQNLIAPGPTSQISVQVSRNTQLSDQ